VPILTGQLEEHIVADIAWTALTYVAWTGDHDSEQGPVADLLVETARYWQSRVEVDSDGSRHIRGVIGPDEYHERIDDNAYTNVLARWNLTAAADIVERLGMSLDDEAALWRTTSRHIADGYDTTRGIYEQFDGFFDLDEVMAASLGEPPLAADALLGRERIRRTQIIKQPDVVMLHHVVPDSMRPGTLERDLDFYLPRTSHGSSLSPAITASVLARAGRLEEACHWFGFAASFDFDDVSNTTAGGVHLATLGGLWQALAVGFFGLRPSATGLYVDPHVPDEWGTVTIRIHVRGVPVEVEASGQRFAATAPVPITVLNRHGASATGCRVRAASDGNDWRFT
jgi:trehalose/maltose hydrolase-like predicted phosphorylase